MSDQLRRGTWRTFGPHFATHTQPVTARIFQLFGGRSWSLALLWHIQDNTERDTNDE